MRESVERDLAVAESRLEMANARIKELESTQRLRLDYSVECEWCGAVNDIPARLSEPQAQAALRDQGWRLVDDENRCPECVNKIN